MALVLLLCLGILCRGVYCKGLTFPSQGWVLGVVGGYTGTSLMGWNWWISCYKSTWGASIWFPMAPPNK